ncbi:hypothetical protein DY000_02039794 [Brassica cretica]|uniref:Uncharacterized protein n=1 Tax=Brassica cretica TaxID=69181 RepID=A0ABQ7B6Y1_BRACR|nr:hypothetical protein DY000_02039794 [Brassica cretica]
MTVPYGTIRNLPVQVGNCILHTEFQVVEMSKDHEMPLIFGKSFMATVGAVVDMPNKRVSFSNINKKVFYKALPTSSQIRYASCISVVSGEQVDIVPKKERGKKGEIKEVLDGDPHTDTKKLSRNAKVNEKFLKKRVKGDPMMTLIPLLCDEKSIEYEVKCKENSDLQETTGSLGFPPLLFIIIDGVNFGSHRNAKVKEKVEKKRVKGDPMMTLIPRKYDEKSIEYEVKCKGASKPFSKVRVILTHELREKGEVVEQSSEVEHA